HLGRFTLLEPANHATRTRRATPVQQVICLWSVKMPRMRRASRRRASSTTFCATSFSTTVKRLKSSQGHLRSTTVMAANEQDRQNRSRNRKIYERIYLAE